MQNNKIQGKQIEENHVHGYEGDKLLLEVKHFTHAYPS